MMTFLVGDDWDRALSFIADFVDTRDHLLVEFRNGLLTLVVF